MVDPSVGIESWPPLTSSPPLEEDDDEDERGEEDGGGIAPGRPAVLPVDPLAPGREGMDEPVEPDELVLGMLGIELELLELELLELELEEDELLLGMDGARELEAPGEPELDAVGIPDEVELLLDVLCFSSHALSINPKVVATNKARKELRCVMLIHPPKPARGGQISSALRCPRSTPLPLCVCRGKRLSSLFSKP